MVTASHQLNILVSVITIHCSVHTHIMQHMMRKSNCNRMQLLILILWPVLSEDAIKHPMVGKSQEHEHNCYMHQLWSTRKYCRITPASFQGLHNLFHLHYAQINWEGLRCSYHIICSTDSLAVHTGQGDVGHLCHKSQGKNSTPF